MPIQFRCAACQQLLGIAKRKAGSVVDCPTCRVKTLVPLTSTENETPFHRYVVNARSQFRSLIVSMLISCCKNPLDRNWLSKKVIPRWRWLLLRFAARWSLLLILWKADTRILSKSLKPCLDWNQARWNLSMMSPLH